MAIRYLSGINVDSNTLFVDSTNNRVGIGTGSPSQLLHINASSGAVYTRVQNNVNSLYLGLESGGIAQVSSDVSSLKVMANTFTSFETAGSERMRITSAGNVGIGTTSPDNVLDLGAASQGRALTWDNYSNVFGAYSSGNLVLSQNFYGDTATDTYKTSLTASYGAAGILISGTAAGLNGVMRFYVDNATSKTAGAAFTPTERMQISGNGAIKFSTYGSGSFTGTATYGLAVDSSGNIIEVTSTLDGSGTTNYVTKWVDSNTLTDSQIFDNGTNVGIGTASPAQKLHVDGAIRLTSNPSVTGDGSSAQFWNGAGVGPIIAGANFQVKTNGNTTALHINSSQNVGIGTTSPGAPLHVYKSDTYSVIISRADWNTGIPTKLGLAKEYGVLGFISSDLVETTNDTSYIALNYKSGLTTYAEGLRVYNNGNVGIGTTAPGGRLHIATPDPATNFIAIDFRNPTYGIYGKSNSISGRGNTLEFTATDYNTSGSVVTREVLTLRPEGNVGIGTTSPASKLDVVGSGAYDGAIRVRSTSTNTPAAVLGVDAVSSADGYVGTINNWPFQIRTNDVGRIHIDTSGNVGIGTTAPTSGYKLDVVGSILSRVASGNTSVVVQTNNANGAINAMAGSGLEIATDGTNQNIAFRTGVSTRMYIKSDGNVGIGTTSPGSKLDVYLSEGSYIRATNASSGVGAGNHWGFGLYEGTSLSAAFRIVRDGTGDQVSIGTANNQSFAFWQNNTERMRIAVGGNVGIGTVTPQKLLHINGGSGNVDNLVIESGYVSAGVGVAMQFNRGGGVLSRIRGIEEGNWNGGLLFEVRNGANSNPGYDGATNVAMKIATNGNVGIGTTNPTAKLFIEGNDITLNTEGSAQGKTLYFRYSNGANVQSDSYLYFSTGGSPTEKMRITDAGNVGIGTTSPGQKLHVSGFIRANGLQVSDGTISAFIGQEKAWTGTGTSNNLAIASETGFATNFYTNGDATVKMTIAAAGNVGIGNSSPKTKLDVNGTIGFGSKSITLTDTFAAALTVNMNDHTGCYVKITAFGDWSNHSSMAYLGEFFLQNGSGAYGEPGMIIRQVDNTSTDDIQAQIIDPAGAGTRDFIIELKTTSSVGTPTTAYIQYEVRGQYNSVS